MSDWIHPERGPDGRELRTYAVRFDGDPKRVLISISGTHGAEAFIGSLIQQRLLERLSKRQGARLPTVILIHNLNCFGSAWIRRGNHQNIDLNRNSWSGPVPEHPAFERYVSLLGSKGALEFGARLALQLPDIPRFGLGPVLEAVARGQSAHPESPFYCGRERSFEIRSLQNYLKSEINPDHLQVLDIHTGLGSYMQESLIAEPDLTLKQAQEFESLFATKLIDTRSPGYYPTTGTLGQIFPETFPQTKIGYLTQEFGTRNFLTVLKALVLENSSWQKQKSMDSQRIDPMLHAFFPAEKDWRDQITQVGVQRFFALHDSI